MKLISFGIHLPVMGFVRGAHVISF